MGYENAGKGLRTMFKAEIGAIIFALLIWIPVVGVVGLLVCGVLSLYGLYIAGKDFEGLKTAFVFTVIELVLSLLTGIPFLGKIIKMVNTVVGLLVIYCVCHAMRDVLIGMGKNDIADLGKTVWTINLICTVLSLIISLIALIPFIGALLAAIPAFIVGVATLVGSIMYLVYLNKCSNVF